MRAGSSDGENFFDSAASGWDSICFHDPSRLFGLMRLAGLGGADFSGREGRILDVGTGTGVLIPFIRHFCGFEIDAVDSSRPMLEAAGEKLKEYGGIRYIHCDAADAEAVIYSSGPVYDAVFMYSVVPHFSDRAKVFRLVRGALKPRGKLIVFHSQSRAAINGVHESTDGVGYETLPPAAVIARETSDAGLEAKCIMDTEYSYLIICQKARAAGS